MAKGIVSKIWNIKEGSMGRSGGAQITDSISYITDEEKCDEQLAAVTALSGTVLCERFHSDPKW